jgi:hypothetical protein
MSDDGSVSFSITQLPNPWARISEIAAKVGVKPHRSGDQARITVLGADGHAYDLWEVIAAVLDKIESGIPKD